MTEETTDPFPWGENGEQYWRNLAAECGVKNELAIRFACLRHSGASQTAAAKLAGYSGDADAIRGAGHKAARSNAVTAMLALASAEAPTTSKIMDRAARVELLSDLARKSPDQNLKLRAVEGLNRMDETARERDGEEELSLEEIAREMIGASPTYGYVYFAEAACAPTNEIGESISVANLPYIKVLSPHLKRDFHESWRKFRAAINRDWLIAQFDAWSNGPYVPPEQVLALPDQRESEPKADETPWAVE